MDIEHKNKEISHAAKSDLARIDFDFDFDIDVAAFGVNPNEDNFEKETQKILEMHEKFLQQEQSGSNQNRKLLTKEEKEIVSEILKSQTEQDLMSICEDVLKKSENLKGKNLLMNVFNFLDQIGLFGNPNKLSNLELNFASYQQFAENKYGVSIQNVHTSIPIFVKAFYEYLIAFH